MNYRHAFHAGNFADVFKHILLTRMLVYLMRKEQPLRYMDTHAGIGRYDLSGDEASRTGEWHGGVGRVLTAQIPPDIAELIAPWLAVLGPSGKDGKPESWPGSPALAQALLRPQDKIALAELHPQDFTALRRRIGRDERVRFAEMDGYAALNAWTPPVERRGLVLIDPPFEARDEFATAAKAVLKAWKKWPTGVYAIWYPVKDEYAVDEFLGEIAAGGIAKILRLEIGLTRPAAAGPLTANGLCVINPPFVLHDEAHALLPWLAGLLGKPREAFCRIEWIAGEA